MKTLQQLILVIGLITIFRFNLNAQVDSVIVEIYYISEANDSLDSFGGRLKEGSFTYRIFVDLSEGYKILSLGGYPEHPLIIASTENFFNHTLFGRNGGFEYPKGYLQLGSVPLDSWLTIGYAASNYLGVLKSDDQDDSLLIGGANNIDSIISNKDVSMGIPPTVADGYLYTDTSSSRYSLYVSNDSALGNQSTRSIFAVTEKAISSAAGIAGPSSANRVLVAQLTTSGELSFELNLEISDSAGTRFLLLARDTSESDVLPDGMNVIRYDKWLKYPFKKGCTNPWFLQYDRAAIKEDGSCRDSITFGCLDPNACNFDPSANLNLPQLCCYGPDSCDNREIEIVCPNYNSEAEISEFNVYPNPASEKLNFEILTRTRTSGHINIFDPYGNIVMHNELNEIAYHYHKTADISNLRKGLYFIHLIVGNEILTKRFIKE